MRETFGQALRHRRQARSMSLRSLASRVRYDHAYLGQIERGEKPGSLALATACDDALDAAGELVAVFRAQRQPVSTAAPGSNGLGTFTTSGPPSADATVAASQSSWRDTRDYLAQHGPELAVRAAELYDPGWQVAGTRAIAAPHWLPAAPVPLENITLTWDPQPPEPRITGREAEARPVLPLRVPGHAFTRYTSAIRYLQPPSLFENRPSYRLLDLAWGEAAGTLRFGLSTFFEKVDVAEPLSHELASAARDGALSWAGLPFRARISDPFDLAARAVNPGIGTLTIRRDTTDGSGTFFLLWRDPTQVLKGNHYCVVPAGEFQPASIGPDSVSADLDLWRNIAREYSEELLNNPEHDGSRGDLLDYDCWPFYREMQRARERDQLRAYALGVVLDALGLNAGIVTAVVIDDVVFDRSFRDLVTTNSEGRLVTSLDGAHTLGGIPFSEESVRRFVHHEPLGSTSSACLALAWQHQAHLLPAASRSLCARVGNDLSATRGAVHSPRP